MQSKNRTFGWRTLAVLHPVFALTGVLHAVGGALLPSLALTFNLRDSDSGLLFLLYFAGTSMGAVFCRGNYARAIALGFAAMMVCCLGITVATRPMLPLVFLLLGISVGVPMSGVSMYVGRAFPERCAPLLTFLNFSWSVGALAAPLLAARILMHHGFRTAYMLFALASAVAAVACTLVLKETQEPVREIAAGSSFAALRLVVVFAFAAFLQVGIENTVAAWLPTYTMRMAGEGVVLAAASSSLYWIGFLSSRGFSSLLLLHANPVKVFRVAILVALGAAVLLTVVPTVSERSAAMFVLGASLAPIYPLVLAGFFARARHSADTRWVLATAGFGGSVLPWLAGTISTHTGSLRFGMFTIPAALLLMVFVLPALRQPRPLRAAQ
jgi:fucose permease